MTLDFFIVLACSVLGLVAHGSRHQSWLGWILRVIIGITFGGELVSVIGAMDPEKGAHPWVLAVLISMCAVTGLLLFLPFRRLLSYLLSALDFVFSGQLFMAFVKKTKVAAAFIASRIFVPESMPHMVALWIYVTSAGFLLGSIDPLSMKMPALPLPMPVPLDQLFTYNGLGLVLLAFCGIGIFVTRKPLAALTRLGWAKPTLPQLAIGLALIFVTFAYDAFWSLFTHQMEGNLASKLSVYNAGTFNSGGGAGPSLVLALATGLCAGIGEETLIRGALQPVFGIVPAALLHGLLHGQFSHAPVFMFQVAGWSAIMGIVRRYTNTTTTIIGHTGFNLLTTFMFAFNP